MKKLLAHFLMVSILSITLISCDDQGDNRDDNNSKKDTNDMVKQNDYEPGQDWNLVWSDEFETASIDTNNWNFQVLEAGHFNEEWQRYTNSRKNAYIEDNQLVIEAIHEGEKHGMNQYTSARLNTANKQVFKYGKIAARIKLPYSQGIWPAFWMLGANIDENGGDTPWPQCGEIDILELYGSKNDSIVEANIHYADETGSHTHMGAIDFHLKEGKFADDFHIFELEWNAERIAWLVDGEEYASVPITADTLSEFHEEFFLLLNVAVGGTWAGRPDERSIFPQKMYVDWIKVYEKKG